MTAPTHLAEFNDPRLAELYDVQFGWTREDDFFLSVVAETPAARVLDLGCGTGRLALAMAAAGHRVTGVDPAGASLAIARRKPGADAVRWVEGTSRVLGEHAFDVTTMTSHVAQFVVTDADWHALLADLRRALVPGGRLVFDTRDPRARHWEAWNPRDRSDIFTLDDGPTVHIWSEVTGIDGLLVSSAIHYEFSEGTALAATATLRWRTEAELRSSLTTHGFALEQIYGGWNRDGIGHSDGEFLVIASSTGR